MPISITTISSETPDSNSHKRKRSLEPDNTSPSQTLTSASQRPQIDITHSSTNVTPSQTRRSAPPTPISPSTKRPKYSYTQHPSHWALDGNILVQIELVRFKLHRSRLVKHSGYFRRVLEGTAGGEEGIMNLDDTGVKVTDFEVLLDALEDFMDYFYTIPPFSTASSILRASTALSFDKYTSWARRYLTDMWPTSIDRLSTSRIPHAIESLALARECNVPSILKRVLYELVRTPRFGQNLPSIDGGVPPQLSPADVLVLGTAREELITLWIDVTTAPCSTGSALTKGLAICAGGAQNPTCTTRKEPRATSVHVRLVASGVFRDFLWDPVCGLQALVNLDWAGEGFCHGCVEMRRAVWRTTREKVWEKLDMLFKLGVVRNA
ncbi:hypothetical protein BDZ94DRAFT_1172374 [Collybia nuda]|uniref:BTB domain-containing protein n=1 Tax=Collybia nuda TaxID=64659 RepID=A0A9P6CFJ8_9AGAR|nr:hypothetical protein BDZ94DRAFT_1172374 [Collybia nuda]